MLCPSGMQNTWTGVIVVIAALLVFGFSMMYLGASISGGLDQTQPIIPEANGQGELDCLIISRTGAYAGSIVELHCTLTDGSSILCLQTLNGLSCDWP